MQSSVDVYYQGGLHLTAQCSRNSSSPQNYLINDTEDNKKPEHLKLKGSGITLASVTFSFICTTE